MVTDTFEEDKSKIGMSAKEKRRSYLLKTGYRCRHRYHVNPLPSTLVIAKFQVGAQTKSSNFLSLGRPRSDSNTTNLRMRRT